MAKSIWRVLSLFILMLVGFYLALSSIISLSYISDNEDLKIPISLRFDSAFKRIDTLQINSGITVKMEYKLGEAKDNYSKVVEGNLVIQGDTTISDSSIFIYNKQVAPILTLLTKQITLLTNEQIKIVQSYYDYNRNRTELFQQAQTSFKENVKKLSSGLLSQYSSDLISFLIQIPSDDALSNTYNNWDKNYSVLNQTLINTARNLKTLYYGMIRKKYPNDLLSLEGLGIDLLPKESEYNIQIHLNKLALPKPGKFGEDWGIVFAPFIEWIAGSKNNDVLLLIGMIGFALFGATISTFVIKTQVVNGNSLSENILSVIVKGFSAAIVVFLSARGGLAILNNGKSDPNPLILFLFVFIGAVFSEPIWNWARQKVSDTFPSK